MPPNHFESEVESFLEGSHGDRTHIKRADHHTVTPLCGTLLSALRASLGASPRCPARPCRRPWVPQSGPVGQVGRSETTIAFAGAGRASNETAIAFAGAGRASNETVIAFAGAKWVFLVHFSGAEVMPVSAVPCWG